LKPLDAALTTTEEIDPMAKNFRLKIASTYKRKVEVEVPGDGLEPMKAQIIVEFRDIDPETLQSDQEKIEAGRDALMKLMHSMRDGAPDEDQVAKAEEDLEGLDEVKPKIDRILVAVELPEGSEVLDSDDNPVTGKALLDFAKKYPRWKKAILKKYAEENEEGETAALGNLLRSGGRGRG
jgi:hypothetical protein